MYTEEHSRWCRSVSNSSSDAAAPVVNKKIVAWRPNGQMCESSSVPQRSARNASLACLPSFSSGHPAASIEFPTALSAGFKSWPSGRKIRQPLQAQQPRQKQVSQQARATAAALYQAEYDEMHNFTLRLTSSGVPVLKRSRCRPLRSKRVLKLDAACSTLSWGSANSAQLCEVTAVGRSRCAVTLALPRGGVSLVLPSTLDAELLESLLLTLCADKSSSKSCSSSSSSSKACSDSSS
jgi:hypothetical protein